jgi:hypothetical protein
LDVAAHRDGQGRPEVPANVQLLRRARWSHRAANGHGAISVDRRGLVEILRRGEGDEVIGRFPRRCDSRRGGRCRRGWGRRATSRRRGGRWVRRRLRRLVGRRW